ncbi:Uncharacterized [Syntrophomonas zehnderi OL-4]|uniref:Uncharacterized n=1 Tax=Syntrophomonas zehnderi OL-4 TaxID=690567 RepID=A0A0E3W3S1_9FIRM|nr:hypothetical protein [Syntrophomonas zehnderi]CFY01380.1 Uncharacterized [Syntrophomonas zehnderi OL-4]
MQTILEKLKALPQENLFLYWQKELELKKELRQHLCEYRQVQIEDGVQYNFLKHSLAYTGCKQTFFSIVFLNMNSLQVQSALLAESQGLVEDFWHSLPGLIKQEKPAPSHLQFLINIFREDFIPDYTDVLQTLELEDCEYLLARTANKSLRKLLKDRQTELLTLSHQDANYGLNNLPDRNSPYPGLYGDKIVTIKQALANIQTCSPQNNVNPNETERSETLIETAQLLFSAGLLGDSLALLRAIYEKEQTRKYIEPQNRVLITRNLSRVLHKTLSMYALLAYPVEAFRKAGNIYQVFFPGLIPDKKTLLFLELYQNLIAHHSGNLQYTLLELADTCRNFNQADDDIDIMLKMMLQPFEVSSEELTRLLNNMQLQLSPHEAYVTMEILRYLEKNQLLDFSRENYTLILNNYMQLFAWIPSPLFLNREIINQMTPGIDEQNRQEANRIWQTRNSYSPAGLYNLNGTNPAASLSGKDNCHYGHPLDLRLFLGVF